MATLEISNLSKRFGDKQVLNGLNLSVPENSVFGFIGKNGSGKTTTMKTVLGLLNADEGEITVNGEKVTFGQTKTNRFIGYLPDVPEFYTFMTAPEYLRFCGEIIQMNKSERENRCQELLSLRRKWWSRGCEGRVRPRAEDWRASFRARPPRAGVAISSAVSSTCL